MPQWADVQRPQLGLGNQNLLPALLRPPYLGVRASLPAIVCPPLRWPLCLHEPLRCLLPAHARAHPPIPVPCPCWRSTWIENVKRAGVTNAMVVALDDATKTNVEQLGFPVFRMDIQVAAYIGVGRLRAVWACRRLCSVSCCALHLAAGAQGQALRGLQQMPWSARQQG